MLERFGLLLRDRDREVLAPILIEIEIEAGLGLADARDHPLDQLKAARETRQPLDIVGLDDAIGG
jgi:hypothetical protein